MLPAVPDLRRLRHFVTVAELGGFTRAAATLHLSQQALSSSVQQLEKELDAKLFVREGRRITLTKAGRVLLNEGRPLLAAAQTVAGHVNSAATDVADVYVVGHTPALGSAEVYELLEPAIDEYPLLSFTFQQMYPDQLMAAVLDGSVQLGLRRGMAPAGNVATAVIGYHAIRVAVPANHRLAAQSRVAIGDLVGETIALWAPPGLSYYSDFLVSACRRAGFEPRYVISRVQGAATVAAPLTTQAIAFVTASAGSAMDGRVRVIDLATPLLVPVQALWQRHTVSSVRDVLMSD